MSGGADGRVSEPLHGGDPSLGWTTLDEIVPGQVYTQVTRPYWIDPLNPAAVDRFIDELRPAQGQARRAFRQRAPGDVERRGVVPADRVAELLPQLRPPLSRDPVVAVLPRILRRPLGLRADPGRSWTSVFAHRLPTPRTGASRHDYWEAVSARFAEVYYGGLARWSTANGIGFVGQLLAEEDVPGHSRPRAPISDRPPSRRSRRPISSPGTWIWPVRRGATARAASA